MKAPRLFPEEVQIPEAIRPALDLWLAYKKERDDKPYKTLGLAALVKTFTDWGPERAMAAVQHSMAANYAGCFEPKNGNGKHTQEPLELTPGEWICSRCGRASGMEFQSIKEGRDAGWWAWLEDGSGRDRGLRFARLGALRIFCPTCAS